MMPDREAIAPKDYETFEILILSGQVDARVVMALIHGNPEFAEWYRERAKERVQRKEAQR